MAQSRRGETAESEAQLKINIPPGVKRELKREAVDLDVPMKWYALRILERRLPWAAMVELEERAKEEGMTYQDFLLKTLRKAGVLKR
ncbi:hypothetical protein [Polyangium spumosum]|uniref:Uncharacterized protein n=1 Tax=Polyangium spumosum TaxID=889282 RepID=A0A6N7PXN5_9BACT|nr:hypothetical protein [Polyangium spumosum]MRG94995.1 hypothetical protein [Polyangium spumosum]